MVFFAVGTTTAYKSQATQSAARPGVGGRRGAKPSAELYSSEDDSVFRSITCPAYQNYFRPLDQAVYPTLKMIVGLLMPMPVVASFVQYMFFTAAHSRKFIKIYISLLMLLAVTPWAEKLDGRQILAQAVAPALPPPPALPLPPALRSAPSLHRFRSLSLITLLSVHAHYACILSYYPCCSHHQGPM
jgi:hypothetical protein